MTVFSQFSSADTFIQLKSDFGYVIFVGIASGILLTWQAMQVGKMRKKFKIYYPIMYSPETTGDGQLFNCYQRAHQNTLENYPVFLMLLFTGGLEYPIPAALGGAVWIAGKVAYSKGYYTGDPKNRMRGGIAYLGLLTMLGCTSKLAAKLLKWI